MDTTPASTVTRADLERLTAQFRDAEAALDTARETLHEGIVRHLTARSAPPGKIADHTPYDRGHVGRLGKAAGVPPLRGPNAGPAPVYTDTAQAKALTELDELTAAFREAEAGLDARREAVQAAIVSAYAARTFGPRELEDMTPYDRNHIQRIVKAAGVPSIRG